MGFCMFHMYGYLAYMFKISWTSGLAILLILSSVIFNHLEIVYNEKNKLWFSKTFTSRKSLWIQNYFWVFEETLNKLNLGGVYFEEEVN